MELTSTQWKELDLIYLSALREALCVEEGLVTAFPEMARKATDRELIQVLRSRLEDAKSHVQQVHTLLQRHAVAETDTGGNNSAPNMSVGGEATSAFNVSTEPLVRDLMLLGTLQQIEHSEVARYGTLRRWAELLELHEDRLVLDSIEEQEENADRLFTDLADRINMEVFRPTQPPHRLAG